MSINYCVNPDTERFERENYKRAKEKFEQFKLESNININIIKYEIIVVNNSKSAQGILDFIKNICNYVDKYIKIYLYKHDAGMEYFIGPIYIDSVESSHVLSRAIVDFNRMDDYVIYPESIETTIKEYFDNFNDSNQINLFF